jgi:hypothetical protein
VQRTPGYPNTDAGDRALMERVPSRARLVETTGPRQRTAPRVAQRTGYSMPVTGLFFTRLSRTATEQEQLGIKVIAYDRP